MYMALFFAVQGADWLRRIAAGFGCAPAKITPLCKDNSSAICVTQSSQFHVQSSCNHLSGGTLGGTSHLMYCSSENMVADMLTKGLCKDQFVKLRELAGVKPMPEDASSFK